MQENIYKALGLTPIVNAAGTFTELGGSLMPAEVVAASNAASQHFVDFRELQDRVGQRIAEMLNVEAALVTGGAASGMMLATAAAIAQRDADFVTRHATSDSQPPYEVIRQRSHRDLYDRQIETCGVRIVEVESERDLENRITDRTVMLLSYNVYEPHSTIQRETWLRLAHEHAVPTLLDAAADTPPVSNLWRFNQLGYDMVTFSGGKAIRGPQSSGLLLGRRELIAAAKRNAVPNEGVIGRVAKVSKEDIVGLWKALELFVGDGEHNGDHISTRCLQQLQIVQSELSDIQTLQCTFITPDEANHFPHLKLLWDEQRLQLTASELATQLRAGSPPIATGRVYGTGQDGLLISAINLQPGEAEITGRRIREELTR